MGPPQEPCTGRVDVKHGSPSLGLAGLATGLAQTPILAVGLEILQIKYIITKGSRPDTEGGKIGIVGPCKSTC